MSGEIRTVIGHSSSVPFLFLRANVDNIDLKQPSSNRIRRLNLPHGYPKHKGGQEVQLALNRCLCCVSVSRRGEGSAALRETTRKEGGARGSD